MSNEETREKIKKLKSLLDSDPSDTDISEWEYNFIQDQVIFMEENKELEDSIIFTKAQQDKVEEIYERYHKYL
jgi:hypothetical protein